MPARRRAVAAAALVAVAWACARPPAGRPGNPRVVVLGFDGADPRLVRRAMAEGRLRSLAALAARGAFLPLATTAPPQSPVAWATFATGLPPGRHGVFGLVGREPGSHSPEPEPIRIEPALVFAGLLVRAPQVHNRRQGETFWKIADAHGIASVVLHVPYSFPPDDLAHGRMLSGVGVPDLRGSTSGFTFVSSRTRASEGIPGGGIIPIAWDGQRAEAEIAGLRAGRAVGTPLRLRLEREDESLRVDLGGARTTVGRGEWSEWLAVSFPVTPFLSAPALFRFRLDALEPELRLYLSSPSYDPRDPWIPISAPHDLSARIARAFGLFETLGWAEPTAGLDAGVLDEVAFLESVAQTLDFSRVLLLREIDQRDAELVVAVFPEIDRIDHMFHRFVDPASPLYDEAGARRYGEVIDRAYDAMDRVVEDVQSHLPETTRLIVLSDHGFHAFDRGVNLDTWLEREGLMTRRGEGGDLLEDVDWRQTRAYPLGLGQIYLNLRGREPDGVVEPGAEAEALVERLRSGLLGLRDPENGAAVVARADRGAELFAGPFVARAPDLQVSFAPGYRTAFAAARGASPAAVVEPNLHRWSGDHSVSSPEDTPGILIASFPLATTSASLLDVAPTVLSLLGVAVPAGMEGRVLE